MNAVKKLWRLSIARDASGETFWQALATLLCIAASIAGMWVILILAAASNGGTL
jgi:hypothetical protein